MDYKEIVMRLHDFARAFNNSELRQIADAVNELAKKD